MDNKLMNLRFVLAYDMCFLENKKSVSEIIDICKKSGFYGIEATAEKGIFTAPISELAAIGDAFKAADLSINTFHLPYKHPALDDIASLYESDRSRAVDKMKSWIEKAVAAGSKIGILHPTARRNINNLGCYDADKEGLDRICAQANKSLQTLLKFCEQFDFKIALENMPPYSGGMLGCRNSHLTKLYEENRHPNLGFCLDTGHAMLAYGRDCMSTYYAMKEHLIAFHLADNGGDRDSHLQPGKGNYFWKEFFTDLNKTGFKGNVCVETPPYDFGPDFTMESWCTMFKELNELVEKSLA